MISGIRTWKNLLMPTAPIIGTEVVTEEEVLELCRALFSLIKSHKRQALQEQKQFLILLGEDHFLGDSFVVKVLVLNIARALNISNCYVESTKADLIGKQFLCMLSEDIFLVLLSKWFPIKWLSDDANELNDRTLRNAWFLGLNVIAIDDLHHSPDMNLRNEVMVENLKLHKQDGVAVCGFFHVAGMVEDYNLRDDYHILDINIFFNEDKIETLISDQRTERLDLEIKNAFHMRNYRDYKQLLAEQRTADYLCRQQGTKVSRLYTGYVVDKVQPKPKERSKDENVDIKTLVRQLERPSLKNFLFIIKSGLRACFSFFRNICREHIRIPKEKLKEYQRRDTLAIQEFSQTIIDAPQFDVKRTDKHLFTAENINFPTFNKSAAPVLSQFNITRTVEDGKQSENACRAQVHRKSIPRVQD